MKRSILTLAINFALATGLSAQYTASATMQVRATVVESSRLNVIKTEAGAQVTSESLGTVMFSVTKEHQAGQAAMTPSNVSLSSDEKILSYGKTNPTRVQKIEIEAANLSASPQTYIVSAYYQ